MDRKTFRLEAVKTGYYSEEDLDFIYKSAQTKVKELHAKKMSRAGLEKLLAIALAQREFISQKLKENDQTPSDIEKLIVHGVSELVSLVDKHTITTLSKRRSIQSQQ